MTDRNKEKTNNNLSPVQVDSVEGGIIAMLFRIIVSELNLTQQIPFLAKQAERATNKGGSEVSKFKSRTQFINQATSKSMTFKIFVRLLRFIVGVCKIKLIVVIERANGKKTTHETPFFNIAQIEPEDSTSDTPKLLDEALKRNEGKSEENINKENEDGGSDKSSTDVSK